MASASSTETVEKADDLAKPPFLRRVRIRGYKSIAFCDVTLEPLTILVGRNASGKSNFVDALAFLADAVRYNVTEAVYRHGGTSSILCRSVPTREVRFALEYLLIERSSRCEIAHDLRFSVAVNGTLGDVDESIRSTVTDPEGRPKTPVAPTNQFVGNQGYCVCKPQARPSVAFGGTNPVPMLSEQIAGMRLYNFIPERMRRPQKWPPETFLESDGANLASVIHTTEKTDKNSMDRVRQFLSVIAEPVHVLGAAEYGDYKTVRFQVDRGGAPPLEFDTSAMSDGTLRALAALVAVYQNVPPYDSPSLVAIEEPETALHPAAMRALVAALDEATLRTQILLTTHSADMLDNSTIHPENVRVVQMIDGQTLIGPMDEAGVEIIRRGLNTLGGLERDNLLEPDLDDRDRQQQLAQVRQESSA